LTGDPSGRTAKEADAQLDAVTALVNRRGWKLMLDRKERRCERHGAVAIVLVVDIDGLKGSQQPVRACGWARRAATGCRGAAWGVRQHRRGRPPSYFDLKNSKQLPM